MQVDKPGQGTWHGISSQALHRRIDKQGLTASTAFDPREVRQGVQNLEQKVDGPRATDRTPSFSRLQIASTPIRNAEMVCTLSCICTPMFKYAMDSKTRCCGERVHANALSHPLVTARLLDSTSFGAISARAFVNRSARPPRSRHLEKDVAFLRRGCHPRIEP